MLAENLAEEEGIEAGKQDHATLWLMFACGLGENEAAVRSQQLNAETIGLIETFWSAYFSVQYKDVAAFSILAITLIFMPTGLLGRAEVEKV